MCCKQNHDELETASAEALYVHVPFCRAKCAYCDFCSVPLNENLAGRVTAATRDELASGGAVLTDPPGSIFVGGGTPTALPASLLGELLGDLATLAGTGTEFSVEANPGTLDSTTIARLADAGVNRVSLGVQSFHADELAMLERIHTPRQARLAAENLRRAGFENIGVDLMYALPGQSADSWRLSLLEAIELGVDHVSCYALSFEEGTKFASRRSAGELREMDDDLQADLYHQARETLQAAGLRQYEISNFARPGFECRHNIVYWRNEPYLGVGPAAAGYIGGERRVNSRSLEEYIRRIETEGSATAESESLRGAKRLAETLLLGLRLTDGVNRRAFFRRFGTDPVAIFPKTFRACAKQGLISISESHIQLNDEALFICNAIFADLLEEAEAIDRREPGESLS
ncbi:MAG: radical SAM family heme chaperone HemW [Phycisphaerae bacterium]